MPELLFTLTITQDGNQIQDVPLIYRFVVPQATNTTIVAAADNNTSTYHPIAAIDENPLQVFMLTMDQAINLNINQLTALPMMAGGMILILGANLTQATASQNIEYNNPSASTAANLVLLAGGT
jgi:hypothetical protein